MNSRLQRLRARMRSDGVSSLLVSDNTNVQWLTGFTGSFGYALVLQSANLFVTDSRYTIQAAEQVKELSIESFASPQTGPVFLKELLERNGVSSIAFERDISYETWEAWTKTFDPVSLVPCPFSVGTLRMIKDETEVAAIRQACKLADACIDHIKRLCRPGVAEYDIGLDIEFFFRRHGAGIAFPPIVASGQNSARPHARATEKKLERGDFLTLDLGGIVDGYCSDITRTFVIGEATDRHRTIYESVLKAQVAAIEALAPGKNGRDIDAHARAILDENGLSKHFGHGLGHGLGRLVHDGGALGSNRDQPIETGQVWTVEPGVYIEGFGGVRIEDDVLVTSDGAEVLTHYPKELQVVG